MMTTAGVETDPVGVEEATPRRSAMEAAVDMRSPPESIRKHTGYASSASTLSHKRVTEWMQLQDHVTSEITMPENSYSMTPPPLFTKVRLMCYLLRYLSI